MAQPHSLPNEAIALYDSPLFQVASRDYGSDTLILTFAERKEPKPADFFGLNFCNKERVSWIAVRSLENDWYLGAEIDQVFAAISEGLKRIAHRRLVLLGYSMGSFGVIRSANIFSPDRIIIAGPIATLNPDLERRWLSDYRELLPFYEACSTEILPWKYDFDTVAIFDPNSEDAAHIDFLEKTTSVKRLEIPGSGHLVLSYLRNSGALGTVMRMLLQPKIEMTTVTKVIKKARKSNRSYLLALTERCSRRPLMQRRVLNYALKVLPNDWEILLAYASSLAKSKELIRAAEIINNIVATFGTRCFSVQLGKAICSFAAAGGNAQAINEAVQLFSGERPRSREMQLWYSRFLRETGAFDAAFAAHVMFMTGDPFEAHAHIERGLILENFGLLHGARDCFRRACELNPRFPPASQHLARMEKRLSTSIVS